MTIFQKLKGLKIPKNVLFICILGVVLMIAGNTIFGGTSNNLNKLTPQTGQNKSILPEQQSNLEYNEKIVLELEAFLSSIGGAGKVKVMVTFDSSVEKIPAVDIKENTNNSNEKDSTGGSRETTQKESDKTIIFQDSQGNKIPVILKEEYPPIKGIVVTAHGGNSNIVKERIINAIVALYNIAPHKIAIFSMKD